MPDDDRRLTLTPRTPWAKLRLAANIKHDRKSPWNLLPRHPHTKAEKQRLANVAWESMFKDQVEQVRLATLANNE